MNDDRQCRRSSIAQAVVEAVLTQRDTLVPIGISLQRSLKSLYAAGGAAALPVKDALHGTWLGHPLHVILTDIPVGAWTAALVLDAAAAASDDDGMARAADLVTSIGLAGAVAAAVCGLVDWSETHGDARTIGVAHAAANAVSTTLYLTSVVARSQGARGAGVAAALAGYAVMSLGAILGGELVTDKQVGVNRPGANEGPDDFVPVIAFDALPDGLLQRVDANDVPVLLLRRGDRIDAIAARCSHFSGKLEEGKLEGDRVVCPLHGSTFCIDGGAVVRGPAVYPQPVYETRIRDGNVEVRSTIEHRS